MATTSSQNLHAVFSLLEPLLDLMLRVNYKLTFLLVPAFLPLAAKVTSAEPAVRLSSAGGQLLLCAATQLMETPATSQYLVCIVPEDYQKV